MKKKENKVLNILFLTLSPNITPKDDDGIYSSILYELSKDNNVYIVSPTQRREKKKTYVESGKNYQILKVRTGNITKCSTIEKGISTILIQNQYKRAIKKYFKAIKFDIILYSTPPITFYSTIKYFKERDNSKTYLMLKDIFPQNAVDIGMFSKKSLLYKYFRKQEINLYNISDRIGCMSPKNREYILQNNDYLDQDKVEVFPNTINVNSKEKIENDEILKLRKKYNIPINSKVFIYGGNLGKPQGVDFIIECLEKVKDLENTFFVICGTGTGYKKIYDFINCNKPSNVLLINGLPKEEYNTLIHIADVGLIFLDYRFTIPNFPSRLLSYLKIGIPVLACTDPNTDIGDIIVDNKFGWKCYSNDYNAFNEIVSQIQKMSKQELSEIGNNGYKFLLSNYLSCDNAKKVIESYKF